MTPEQIVEAVAPIVERAVDQLRAEMQATVEVLAGNDDALVAEIQRLRGSGGEQVAEVLTKAGEAWERFVRAEAEKLGLKVIVPKGGE